MKFVARIRSLLWLVQERSTAEQLGGPNKIVAIDETFFVKKKPNKGGFRGRETVRHKKMVMGFLELDLVTRKATGRSVLVEIPNRKAPTLKRMVERYVVEGSLVFTDSLKSYHWLSNRRSKYSKGEFARTEVIFGQEVRVTTNSVEGLFGRLKKYFRQQGLGRVGKKNYGHLLAEFLWRQRCSAFGRDLFSNLLDEITAWQKEHPQKATFEDSIFEKIPDEYYQDFQSMVDEKQDIPSPEAKPLSPHLEPVPHFPDPEADEPLLTPEAEAPPPDLGLSPGNAAAPHDLPFSKKRHASGGSDSDVEFESLHVSSRASRVKLEAAVQTSFKKVKAEVGTSQVFCKQGHTMTLPAPRSKVWFKGRAQKKVPMETKDCIVCDVCRLEVCDATWRCTICDWDTCKACAK